MLKAKDADGNGLTREEMVDALLRRMAAYTVVLKRQLKGDDYRRLKTLSLPEGCRQADGGNRSLGQEVAHSDRSVESCRAL
jgi:hypothetical protein